MALKDQAVFGSYVGGSMTDLESKLGEPLVVVNQFFNWGDSIKSFISGLGSRVPLATLEPWNYSLSQISSGAADSWLTQVKNDCAAYGKPVYLRPLHEFNGDWYPWSPNSGQEAAFKSAWNHLTGILKQASNVRIIWCPNADTVNRADPGQCWPGQGVDIIGFDGYNWNGTSFDNIFANAYSKWAGLGSQPVWICETGCGESSDKANWANGLFNSTKFPKIQAVVYFSVNKEKDWRIDSSTASLNAFKIGVAATPNSLSGGTTQPPPPPPPPPTGTGVLSISAPTVNPPAINPGMSVSATVSLVASGGDVAIQRALITAREPGSTHSGGPYHDFIPEANAQTVGNGKTLSVSGSFAVPSTAKSGTWEIYATYEDSAGAYHDGPSASFVVGTAGPTPPTGAFAVGNRVKIVHATSQYNNRIGTVRSVRNDLTPVQCGVRLDNGQLRSFQQSWLQKI